MPRAPLRRYSGALAFSRRAVAAVHEDDWIDAVDYPATQVALLNYAPADWLDGTRVVRRDPLRR